jgi:hypothetical protein
VVRNASLSILLLVVAGSASAAAGDAVAIIDWSAWDRILRSHVADGHVDYDGIRQEPGFAATVQAIAGASLDGRDRREKIVFLVNAYNVLSIRGILDGRSPRTAFGKLNFFFRAKYDVAGERMTLNALEKKRLLPLGEPRVHFAIVCSSASCPPLRSEAHTVARLEEQLDDSARRFLNDPTKNRFDPDSSTAWLSKIFKWFSEDFGGSPESIQQFIAPYIQDPAAAARLAEGAFTIRYLDYDWSLNGTFSGADR